MLKSIKTIERFKGKHHPKGTFSLRILLECGHIIEIKPARVRDGQKRMNCEYCVAPLTKEKKTR